MTEKLKPCPFCGGDAKAVPSSFVFGEEREWIVLCAKCCAKTLRFRSESAAIEAWNRRAIDKAERLEGARADWLLCEEVRGTRYCAFEPKGDEE